MISIKSFTTTSAALALISGVSSRVIERGDPVENSLPSCVDFTSYVYAGCYSDPAQTTERALLYDSDLNQNNLTIEKCVAFCKGNDYRYAGVEYGNECWCGASVNGVKADESNCDFSCSGQANETCGGDYYINIYQDPTFPTESAVSTTSDYKSVGCYTEGTGTRALDYTESQLSASSMTTELCLSACKQGGFNFAGTEYAGECYCGVVIANGSVPAPSSDCNMACNGNASETCGGSNRLNLYVATDLESTEPCGSYGSFYGSSSSSSVASSQSSTVASSSSAISSVSKTSASSSLASPMSSATSSSQASTIASSTKTSPSASATTSKSSTSASSTSTSSAKVTSSSVFSTSKTSATTTSSSTIASGTCKSDTGATGCEWSIGNWCSAPLPNFNNIAGCQIAYATCYSQWTKCWAQAGVVADLGLKCQNYQNWCNELQGYCDSSCISDATHCSNGNFKGMYAAQCIV